MANSGYSRTLGNAELGQLISRVQATVISNGTELERLVLERCNLISDIDGFIENATNGETADGVYVCPKRNFKKSEKYCAGALQGIEPDLLIFIVEKKRVCKIVELKDGDAFDTKKSQGEKEHLETFANLFGAKIPFVCDFFICCFNQDNKDAIFEGFKGVFSLEHILTGRELCGILKIDYDEIVSIRQKDADENFDYFIDEILKIDEVKTAIKSKLK